jgi:isoquinoline 1-oxidoreductase beta subunit
MKVATLAQCPIYGGMLAALDERAALAVPGVVKVVKGRDVVFVVADHWAAIQGYVAANVQWAAGPKPAEQGAIVADLDAALDRPGHSAKSQGDLKAAHGREISATYHQPFLAHAAMEPLACTIHVTEKGCEIWSGSQVPSQARSDAAKALGIGEEKVTFHNFQMGGGFGRRLETDMVLRAVELGRAVPYPVKLVWSREEDVQHDMFRPPMPTGSARRSMKRGGPLHGNTASPVHRLWPV